MRAIGRVQLTEAEEEAFFAGLIAKVVAAEAEMARAAESVPEAAAATVSAMGIPTVADTETETRPVTSTEAETDSEHDPAKGGTVTVWVVVPSTLTGDAGGRREIELDLPGEAADVTVTQVLDRLQTELPALERRLRDEQSVIRKHVNVYVGGLDIRSLSGPETPVADGALVQIIAAVSGG